MITQSQVWYLEKRNFLLGEFLNSHCPDTYFIALDEQ
jgi:hypothetical protein